MDNQIEEYENDLKSGLYFNPPFRVEKVIFDLSIHNDINYCYDLLKRMGFKKDFNIDIYQNFLLIYQCNPVEEPNIKKYNIFNREGVYLTKLLQKAL